VYIHFHQNLNPECPCIELLCFDESRKDHQMVTTVESSLVSPRRECHTVRLGKNCKSLIVGNMIVGAKLYPRPTQDGWRTDPKSRALFLMPYARTFLRRRLQEMEETRDQEYFQSRGMLLTWRTLLTEVSLGPW